MHSTVVPSVLGMDWQTVITLRTKNLRFEALGAVSG